MSAIAGCWSRRDALDARRACDSLLEAQSPFGFDGVARSGDARFSAGRRLRILLPEDRFDRQPLQSADGRFLMVADLRLDNREDLLSRLDAGSSGSELSDADVLMRAWQEWRAGLLDRIAGDFAFAIWDSLEETLLLARDAIGERPLYYHPGEGFFAFASMPAALTALPEVGRSLDEERLAAFVADLPPGGDSAFFAGVMRVLPGHFVEASRGGVRIHRYWDPRGPSIRLPRPGDYGEALREQLDRAVRPRLRRAAGAVGSQLSAGLDSGAVTVSAATALAGNAEALTAFTAAPRAGYDGPVPAGRFADESEAAAATASLHPNIRHVVIRPDGVSPLGLLADMHLLTGQPVGHVFNNVWWSAINRAARDRGIGVMLTGEVGNLTISGGGSLETLAELARGGRLPSWAREARAFVRGGFSWANLLNASLGPWLPRPIYRRARAIARGGREATTGDAEFVAPRWKRAMALRLEKEDWDTHPARDPRLRRWTVLRMADPGVFRKASLALWGVEERDPTGDRRLAEFCFRLPAEALLDHGVRLPALRAALAGRIAERAFDSGPRGYQSADWHERIDGRDVLAFARVAKSDAPEAVVDYDAIEAAASEWPREGWDRRDIIYRYQTRLMRALSAADFTRWAMKAG
jgi:asparagine synthase (glutamine-hydrolysing)